MDVIFSLTELLLLLRSEFSDMGIDSIQATVLCEQLGSTHGTDALHSRHVVGTVAAQGKHINHLRAGCYVPLFANLLLAQQFILPAGFPGAELVDMRSDHLPVILVGRYHIYIHFFGCKLQGSGAYHVVSLETGHHKYGYVQGRNYLSQRLKSIYHKARSLGSVGLVGRIEFISEGPSRRVETHCKMGRFLLIDEFKKVFGETI